MTTFNDYQRAALRTAVYPTLRMQGVYYTALGLVNEAGEVAGKVKKMMRDDQSTLTSDRREQILAEIGDVLWYCAALAHELGAQLDHVAEANLNKLAGRAERGTIRGDGDVR
jgi:NTP pyrophosphatase (non-canonical NTP hydrolase)